MCKSEVTERCPRCHWANWESWTVCHWMLMEVVVRFGNAAFLCIGKHTHQQWMLYCYVCLVRSSYRGFCVSGGFCCSSCSNFFTCGMKNEGLEQDQRTKWCVSDARVLLALVFEPPVWLTVKWLRLWQIPKAFQHLTFNMTSQARKDGNISSSHKKTCFIFVG